MANLNGIVAENGVCHKDTINGGHDVWSCENGVSSSSSEHLVVMVHGILGSAADWKFGAEQFVKMLPDKVYVHCSEKNGAKLTLDGVDVMAQRLADEVLEIIKDKPNLRKISFVAHSVGGLVARYAIGILYQPSLCGNVVDSSTNNSHENARGTIGGLEAVNFITVATPHLGSRGNKQVPFLFGLTAIEKVAGRVIHWIFRRTGRHLFLTDGNDEGKPPLLKRMVEDNSEHCFISALRAFRRRVAYSNVGYDHIVGWRTSCIRRRSELPKWEDSLNEKYPHVVHEEFCEAREPIETVSEEDHISDKIEEELVTGLAQVSWEKVDVSFHSSRSRFSAHSVIQVKDHYMHAEGADVILHMIDHFVV
ncbi:putative lipase YDL109C [Beta vulgaris subsp. vulgaris]|uniref:putative lipase YDL109C n=1 Tax=Beta vulgaris subsp. vulgaris TaxID=3555 RepID=UPI002036B68A|nr:putative lipase YDL109C [Beta vulgaris subsp. vulgaris]